jgi:hypothetical protein
MAKQPEDRFPSMSAFVSELEACLTALGQPDDDRTVIVPPVRPRPRARARRRTRRLSPLLALLIGLVLIAVGTGLYLLVRGGGGGGGSSGGGEVHLLASNAYDPEGDGSEHDELVRNATDGNATTSWSTERYGSVEFGGLKHGVGLVLDAGRPSRPASITIVSDTPGFTAQIEAGDSSDGTFDTVSASKEVGSRTTFDLTMATARRYFLVWITKLAPGYERTHLNEVTAG